MPRAELQRPALLRRGGVQQRRDLGVPLVVRPVKRGARPEREASSESGGALERAP